MVSTKGGDSASKIAEHLQVSEQERSALNGKQCTAWMMEADRWWPHPCLAKHTHIRIERIDAFHSCACHYAREDCMASKYKQNT
jgi:hypothetical protein